MCVPSLRFAFVPLSNLTASIAFRVIGILKFQVIVFWRIWGGLLVWVLWQIYSNCSGSCGKGGGRFVAWFWAWFWNCLLTPWTFDSSGHTIGATCLPPTARSDNSFDKFVLLIVLLSLWPIWIGTVRGFGVLFKARVDLVRGIACRWMVMVY